MNETEFRQSLNELLNVAANNLEANSILNGLLTGLGSILALVATKNGDHDEEVVEVARHRLDVEFTRYREYYANARRTSS